MNPIGVVSEFIESLISSKKSDVNTYKLIASSNSNHDIANKVNDRRCSCDAVMFKVMVFHMAGCSYEEDIVVVHVTVHVVEVAVDVYMVVVHMELHTGIYW